MDTIVKAVQALLTAVSTKVKSINASLQVAMASASAKWPASVVLVPLVKAAKVLYQVFCNYLQAAFWAWINKKLEKAGQQKQLKNAASAWASNVTPKYQATHDATDPSKLAVGSGNWEGSAAQAYSAKIPAQREAMTSAKTATESITSQLNTWAQALQVFWSAISKSVTTFLKILMAAVFTAKIPVTSPVAIGLTITGLAKCVVDFIQAYKKLDSSRSSVVQALQSTRSSTVQRWPSMTAVSYSW